jgi:hypothetical protein
VLFYWKNIAAVKTHDVRRDNRHGFIPVVAADYFPASFFTVRLSHPYDEQSPPVYCYHFHPNSYFLILNSQFSCSAFQAAATGTHVSRRSLTCGYENDALRAAVHIFYC